MVVKAIEVVVLFVLLANTLFWLGYFNAMFFRPLDRVEVGLSFMLLYGFFRYLRETRKSGPTELLNLNRIALFGLPAMVIGAFFLSSVLLTDVSLGSCIGTFNCFALHDRFRSA